MLHPEEVGVWKDRVLSDLPELTGASPTFLLLKFLLDDIGLEGS
jgi:hypothetical protein